MSSNQIDRILEIKRDGGTLDSAQIEAFLRGVLDGSVTRAQAAAFLAFVYLRGMNDEETVALTMGMTHSGDTLSWPGLQGPIVDKHSTGGVGDKVSLVLAPLWAEVGGMGNPVGAARPVELYQWFPATAETTHMALGLAILAAAGMLLGVLPRLSAMVLVLLWAQLAQVLPPSDRGIDMLLRNVIFVLAFSRAGETFSLVSWLRHRRWAAPDLVLVPSWPRYLLVVQLVFVYGAAGISKIASSWTPIGGMTALYIAMNDPAFQRIPTEWVDTAFRLTQAGTAVTWFWEWSGPLLLLAFYYRDTRDRGGWLRSTFNRLHVVGLYFLLGVVFHVATHLTLRLGIFPFAMMSLYPAAFHPDEWAAWWRAGARRLGLGRLLA